MVSGGSFYRGQTLKKSVVTENYHYSPEKELNN